MCTVLGLSQNWWSIVGLVIDMIGVALVAKNWNEVYWRAVLRSETAFLREAEATAIEAAAKGKPGFDGELPPGDIESIRRDHAVFKWDTDLMLIRSAFVVAGSPEMKMLGKQVLEAVAHRAPADDIRALFREAWTIAEADIARYAKAPFDLSTTAFLIIILGFALQLIGSWPC